MAGHVQFTGKDAVVNAYNSRGIPVWSITQGRDLVTAGEGADELSTFLQMLVDGRSGATYTLNVYSSEQDPDNITNKTPCNGSFKFLLLDSNQAVSGVGMPSRYSNSTDPITEKLREYIANKVSGVIEKELSGEVEPEQEESWTDVLMDYLKHPEKIVSVISGVQQLMNPNNNTVGMQASLAGVEPALRVGKTEVELDNEMERVSSVLDRLEKADKHILQHLEKLADIAEKKPTIFSMLIKSLNDL